MNRLHDKYGIAVPIRANATNSSGRKRHKSCNQVLWLVDNSSNKFKALSSKYCAFYSGCVNFPAACFPICFFCRRVCAFSLITHSRIKVLQKEQSRKSAKLFTGACSMCCSTEMVYWWFSMLVMTKQHAKATKETPEHLRFIIKWLETIFHS